MSVIVRALVGGLCCVACRSVAGNIAELPTPIILLQLRALGVDVEFFPRPLDMDGTFGFLRKIQKVFGHEHEKKGRN